MSRPSLRLNVAWLLAVLACAMLATPAAAQDEPGFRTYTLKHASAVEMAPQVRAVLANSGGKTDLKIDKQANALLIRGGDEAHRLASQLIAALDRPANPAPRADDASEKDLRGYRLPPGDAEKLLLDLRRRHPTGNFSIHKGTGQIIAIAPLEVHRKLAAEFAEIAPAEKKPGGVHLSTPRAKDREKVLREHELEHISWQSFEDFLTRIWKEKAQVQTERDGEVASFKLKNAAGDEAIARVDRRTNEVTFEGPRATVANWAKLVSVLDGGPNKQNESVQLVPLQRADPAQVSQTIDLIKEAIKQPPLDVGQRRAARVLPGDARRRVVAGDVLAKIFQEPEQPAQPEQPQPDPDPMPMGEQLAPGVLGGAFGPVQIEFLEGLDVIIITGKKEDVARVSAIIQQIEDIARTTEPVIELYTMRNVDSQALGDLIISLYNDALAARYGRVSITPLDKPNSLLLIGRRDSISAVLDIVRKLDIPADPNRQFKVFLLKHMAAADAGLLLTNFFTDPARETLGVKLKISTEMRINAVILHGAARDIAEAERLLEGMDVEGGESKNAVRIFALENTYAADLATVLQSAIGTRAPGVFVQQQPGQQGQPQQQQQQQQQTGDSTTRNQIRESSLIYERVDENGIRVLESGLLTDLRITADINSNSLIVRGPVNSMDLIGAIIKQLDRLPQSEAQIKVFTIINGDATSLMQMLQSLFGQTQTGGGGQFGAQLGQPITAGGENALVPLRFSVDIRTNSITATGSPGDLAVVEAILLRLDESGIRERKTTVYRLKNSYATDVATAITNFLTSQRNIQNLAQNVSPLEQLEREVVVVPEPVTNNLIVSATPRYYDEIERIVQQLDARPPMVMIQVVIAEVSLTDFEEFGAEFGIQDSLLFDRSVAGVPGFNFNNAPLGNNVNADRENLGTQGLTTFSLGRSNGNLGYGGLVLSASNESISILIRALQDAQRLQVLSRPQVMALDNQLAQVNVGQQVPYASGTSNTVNGFQTQTTFVEVGLSLIVQPRTSPDGTVMMAISAEKSDLGPIDQGIAIGIGPNGEAIRQPIINQTRADTTVIARSGQTIVLGGLITKTRGYSSRRIPYLSDVPLLGRLFRFDAASEERTELLIIMTPHIVKTEEDADWIKQVESDRMSWCLADVVEMHGEAGLSGGYGLWGPAQAPIIFPDIDPTGGYPNDLMMPSMENCPPDGLVPSGLRESAPRELDPPLPQNVPPGSFDPNSPLPPPGVQQSNRRAKPQVPVKNAKTPASAPANPQARWAPPPSTAMQAALARPRVEKSDTATVVYSDARSSLPPDMRALPPTGPVRHTVPARPAEREIAPAYYEQLPQPAGAYPVRQSDYPLK